VSAYQECRDQEALDGGRGLSSDYLAWIWRRDLPLTVSSGWERLAAAVLLHARLAEESGVAGTKLDHDRLAAHLSELLLAAQPPEKVGGLGYALLAIQLQDLNRVGRLAQLLARMPLEYRGEPPALLATASLHELLSGPMVSLGAVVFEPEPEGLPTDPPRLDAWGRTLADVASRSKRANRDRAIVLLRQVAALSPSDAEAHLRLAFLLLEDGRLEEAQSAIKAAATLAKPKMLQYYEALVTARLAERQGRLDAAAKGYRVASSLVPGAQTPVLAAARLLFLGGRYDEARKLVHSGLGAASAEDESDPWWQLGFGQTWRWREYLNRFDSMVRPCGR
jgi:tetratricopeptide (TPR) repeat protein